MSKWIWQSSRWPNFSYDRDALAQPLREAGQAYASLLAKAQLIGRHESTRVQQEIWLRDALSTAAIEGERLPMDSVRASVARRLGIRDSLAASTPEGVEGLLDVMETAAANPDLELSTELLRNWQTSLFAGRKGSRIKIGHYRTHEDPMQIVSFRDDQETVHYEAPPSPLVPAEMSRFMGWFNNSRREDGIARAAIAHLWFEKIHPFEDGNGRLGRVIIDLSISQSFGVKTRLHGFSNQIQKNLRGYYDCLGRSNDAANISTWVTWFAENFRDGCRSNETLIDQSITRNQFWVENRHVQFNERQVKALNAVLEKGPGGFDGGLTQKKYRAITGASPATAVRDLNDLLSHGILKPGQAKGRSTYYDISIAGWEWKDPERL